MGNEWECHQKSEVPNEWKEARFIRIRWRNCFGKAYAEAYPISCFEELEGMKDDGLFEDGDLLIDVNSVKEVKVEMRKTVNFKYVNGVIED